MVLRKKRKAFDTPHHAHALTFSVHRRRPHLLLPGAAEALLAAIDEARQKLDFELWAYVVMPEHAHVVLKPRLEAYSMAEVNKAIKSPAAKAIFALHPQLRDGCRIERRDRPGEFRFWQAGGGYDRNLFTVRATWAEIRYVHSNPSKRGLSEDPAEWPWSSAGAYRDPARPTPIPVDPCLWSLDG